jgi:hypothetical protein
MGEAAAQAPERQKQHTLGGRHVLEPEVGCDGAGKIGGHTGCAPCVRARRSAVHGICGRAAGNPACIVLNFGAVAESGGHLMQVGAAAAPQNGPCLVAAA